MKRKIALALILFLFSLSGCSSSSKMSAKDLFKGYLNLDPPPDGITDFRGESIETFPVFLSSAYYQYKAEPSFFDLLTQHADFFTDSEANQSIHQVECNSISQDFSQWTKETITTQNKLCYTGTFVPYIHYLLYDAETHQVFHFIQGTRD